MCDHSCMRELMRGRAIFMILHLVASDYGQVCLAWARFLYGLMMIMASLPTLNLRISQEGKLICQKKSFHFHEYIRIILLLLWHGNANFSLLRGRNILPSLLGLQSLGSQCLRSRWLCSAGYFFILRLPLLSRAMVVFVAALHNASHLRESQEGTT